MDTLPSKVCLTLSLVFGVVATTTFGQSLSSPGSTNGRVLTLESIEVKGSDRITAQDLNDEFGLRPGSSLTDQAVLTLRSHILGMGLFRSCWLSLRKGSGPGLARLTVTVEDDEGVIGDWAIGGSLGMTYGETQTAAAGQGAAPLGYKMGIVSRNLFLAMHRGGLTADVDGQGVLREGQVAYGLPRFSAEGVQFVAELGVVDPSRRYLDTMGFGGRGQALWSRNLSYQGVIRYGIASYVNQKNRYRMNGFPTQVAGPKVAYVYEGRLLRFFPGEGSHGEVSLLAGSNKGSDSTIEINVAHTVDLDRNLYITVDGKVLYSGIRNRGGRVEARFDVPFAASNGEVSSAGLFLRLRGGGDWTSDYQYQGSSAILGLRYHSDGFIAEVGLQITRSPEELTGRDTESKDPTRPLPASLAGASSELGSAP